MLTETKLLSGMKKTISNAESLFQDADCLLKNRSYQRAFTLFHLSSEEIGRYFILFDLLFDSFSGREISYPRLKQLGYSDHTTKLQRSYFAEAAVLFFHSMENDWGDGIKELWDELNAKIKIVSNQNKLKNQSLYVTWENNDFQLPDEMIDEEVCIEAMAIAELRLKVVKSTFEGITKHLEYLKSHFKENPRDGKILTFPHKFPDKNIVIAKNNNCYYLKSLETGKCVMIPKSVDVRRLSSDQAASMI